MGTAMDREGETEGDRVADPEEGSLTVEAERDLLRVTELARLRALVAADLETSDRLHADDFQLVTPGGTALSKAEYLAAVASGSIDYRVCELDSPADVRLYGQAAVIRYRSRIEIVVGGQHFPLQCYWHTDLYEKRDSRWQVVWSQATGVQQR